MSPKNRLIVLALSGAPRPKQGFSREGNALCRYTQKTSRHYDPAFTKKIFELAPHWPKPKQKHSLADIQQFYVERGRLPRNTEKDIAERRLADWLRQRLYGKYRDEAVVAWKEAL